MAFVPLVPIGDPLAHARRRAHRRRPARRARRARGHAARAARRGPRRLGPELRRARPQEGQADRARAARAARRSRHAHVRGRHVRQLRRGVPRRSEVAGGRRRHRVRAGRGPLVHGDRERQHGRVGRVVAAHAGEDPARADDGAAPARCRRSTSSTARGLFLPEQIEELPGRARRRPHLQDEQPAVGARRAADRRRVRRLHRGRRLHADHLRPRLHDRAGVHGDRRRRADQRREEPEDHVARHRRPRGPRPPVGLRRRPRSGRRRPCSRACAATSRACRSSGADFYRGDLGADRPALRDRRARRR